MEPCPERRAGLGHDIIAGGICLACGADTIGNWPVLADIPTAVPDEHYIAIGSLHTSLAGILSERQMAKRHRRAVDRLVNALVAEQDDPPPA